MKTFVFKMFRAVLCIFTSALIVVFSLLFWKKSTNNMSTLIIILGLIVLLKAWAIFHNIILVSKIKLQYKILLYIVMLFKLISLWTIVSWKIFQQLEIYF